MSVVSLEALAARAPPLPPEPTARGMPDWLDFSDPLRAARSLALRLPPHDPAAAEEFVMIVASMATIWERRRS